MNVMACEDYAKQLKAALAECTRLKEENRRLKSLLGIPEEKPNATV
jgi:cell shape-determining protein MreC